jgi:restriction system protein
VHRQYAAQGARYFKTTPLRQSLLPTEFAVADHTAPHEPTGKHTVARKKQAGFAEDIVNMVSAMPWWAGLGLAPVSYLLIHPFSQAPAPAALQPGQIGSMAVQSMVAAGAGVLQYVIPVLCLLGAGLSAWKRRDRAQLAKQVASNQSAAPLDDMSWSRFEQLVGESFRRQGFSVKEAGGRGADGGVDLELRKGSELHLVQCKQWKALKVGVDVVRELYGVMAARGAAGGYVVTSGSFTDAAHAFADGRSLYLIDGVKLQAVLKDGEPKLREVGRSASPAPATRPSPASAAADCPKCGKAMVRRAATRGANEGKSFWGCTAFPACRGIRPI